MENKALEAQLDLDWNSSEQKILLNPKLKSDEAQTLQRLGEKFSKSSHVWIASSGSNSSSNESVKLIALSKAAIMASAAAVNQHLQSSANDKWALCLPTFHVGGLGIFARAHLSGASVFNGLSDEKWYAKYFFDLCQRNQITLSALVPTQIYDLVSLGLKCPASLRAIIVGGGSLSEDLYEKAIDLGWPLLPSFGMTECASQIATADLNTWQKKDRRLQVLSHCQVRLDREGFLEIQSKALMTGYAQMVGGQQVWNEVKTGDWIKTQDKVQLSGSYLLPLGRGADFVKILGEGVNLLELENILNLVVNRIEKQFLNEMTLLAVPESRRGHEIVLVFSHKVQAEIVQKILNEFNQQVKPFEKITKTADVIEIPRTDLGKVKKSQLLENVLSSTFR